VRTWLEQAAGPVQPVEIREKYWQNTLR